jgi:hypothetical protein
MLAKIPYSQCRTLHKAANIPRVREAREISKSDDLLFEFSRIPQLMTIYQMSERIRVFRLGDNDLEIEITRL